MKGETYPLDAETLKLPMIPPAVRPDKKPLSDSPIRRFREELHLSREELGAQVGVSLETVKKWEAEFGSSCPGASTLLSLLKLARKNKYPLLVSEIWDYARKTAGPRNQVG